MKYNKMVRNKINRQLKKVRTSVAVICIVKINHCHLNIIALRNVEVAINFDRLPFF